MRDSFPIEHVFVDRVPAERKERTIYVSIPFRTAVHNCMCGCGTKIVTPLRPPQWKLVFDGDTISLWPSIGSSGLACESHYVIERDIVRWVEPWTEAEIERGRARDRQLRDFYYGEQDKAALETKASGAPATPSASPATPARATLGQWLRRLFSLR